MSAVARITANTKYWPGRGIFSKIEAPGIQARFFHGESREEAIGEAERYARDVLGMDSFVAAQDARDALLEKAAPANEPEPALARSPRAR